MPQVYTDAPQATGGTAPVFAPTGELGDIPLEKLPHALQAGAKPGVNIIAPDGSRGVVPADRYVDAVKAGAKVAPFEDQEIKHPGFWSVLGEDLKNMIPHGGNPNANDQSWQAGRVGAAEHQKVQDDANQAAADAWRQQHGYSLPYRAAAPVAEGLGVNVPGMEKSAMAGDPNAVLGHAAAVPAVMAATEGLAHGVPAAGSALKAGASAARPGVGAVLRAASDVIDPELTGVISPRLAHAQKLAGRLGEALKTAPAEALAAPAAPPELPAGFQAPYRPPAGTAENPAAVTRLPGAPAPAEAAPLPGQAEEFEGVTSPQTEQAAASEPEAVAAEAPQSLAETLNKPAPPADLEKALNQALGGKPLQKGVALKNQAAAAALPEGFTPVESTALKGYKYDPTAREFESVTQGGQHYVHGDVSPEDAAGFEAAESKGKAWQKIRDNPLVAKVVDGERVPVKPSTMGAPGETIAKSKAGLSAVDEKLANLKDFINTEPAKAVAVPASKVKAAAVPAAAPDDLMSKLQTSAANAKAAIGLPENTPRFVYRARDVGETGVPLKQGHAQATADPYQALQYAEPGQRGETQGQVVRIDLSKLKPADYVVKTHPDGRQWVQFTRPLGEDEVSHFAGASKAAAK